MAQMSKSVKKLGSEFYLPEKTVAQTNAELGGDDLKPENVSE